MNHRNISFIVHDVEEQSSRLNDEDTSHEDHLSDIVSEVDDEIGDTDSDESFQFENVSLVVFTLMVFSNPGTVM